MSLALLWFYLSLLLVGMATDKIQFRGTKILFTASDKIAFDSGECCACQWCDDSPCDFPNLSVTFANVADGTCDGCDPTFNDTFVCTYAGNCRWSYQGVLPCTIGDRCFWIHVDLERGGPTPPSTGRLLTVKICCGGTPPACEVTTDPCGFRTFEKEWTADTDIDCSALNDSIPLVAATGSCTECDWSAATCVVTAA